MADDKRAMFTVGWLLAQEPGLVQETVQGLDEANRWLLVQALGGSFTDPRRKEVQPVEMKALQAAFGSLGQARLKLKLWALLTSDLPSDPKRRLTMLVHKLLGAAVVTGVFGVPMGTDGIGHEPLGTTEHDRFHIWMMQHGPVDYDKYVAGYYAAEVARARRDDRIIVEPWKGPVSDADPA